MFSPKRRHPTELILASLVEYISGFMPIPYRLSPFDRLTIENLKQGYWVAIHEGKQITGSLCWASCLKL